LKYNWQFIEFWIIRTFIRLEQTTKQQNETEGVSEVIISFLRCQLCFIDKQNYYSYEKATELNKLSVIKAIPSWGYELERDELDELLFTTCKSEIHNNVNLVKYLVEQGADMKAEDRNSDTPLHVCESR
jgi:hypothetical protein